MTDQLSPTRPETGKPAPRAEEVRPAKAAPKPDPIPAVSTDPAPSAEADARQSWRPRLLMFGVPLLLLAGGAGSWLLSGGSVSTDKAYFQMDKVSGAAGVGVLITEVAVGEGAEVAQRQARKASVGGKSG